MRRRSGFVVAGVACKLLIAATVALELSIDTRCMWCNKNEAFFAAHSGSPPLTAAATIAPRACMSNCVSQSEWQ